MQGTISRFQAFDKDFSFFVENPDDLIQKVHLGGRLYENRELKLIRKHGRDSRIFFDIGSNVGNHAVFIAKVLGAQKIYAFEANPAVAEILKINVLLNGLADVIDTSYLGIGLGERLGTFKVTYPQKNNVGAARLVEDPVGEANGESDADADSRGARVMVSPLDALSIGRAPGFVKIDVEGMEIAVLKGMAKTIQRYKPKIFVEVDDENAVQFDQWLACNGYVKVDNFKRYASNENFVVVHQSQL